ncbi:MAG: thioesterase [Treponema sp.]|nr:thioesterase [Treponema sp.]
MIFEYSYTPVFEDFNKEAALTINALVKILENSGSGHSDMAGDNVFDMHNRANAWVLTEWQIEVQDYPKYGDQIKAETWSEGLSSPLVANRNFLLYKNGEVCAKGATRWILIDMATGRPCRIEPAHLERYENEPKTVFEDKKLSRIPTPEAWEKEVRLPVRFSDIDINDHVHNLTYLEYAREVLPRKEAEIMNFKKLRIAYKTALREGGTAVVRYAFVEDSHLVFIYDAEDHLCCQLQFA